MQEGILYQSLINPDSGMYFEQYSCRLHGDLDVHFFQEAWRRIAERHQVLRSLVTWKNRKQPLLIVRNRIEIPWEIADWRAIPVDEQETRISAYLKSDRQTGLDLSQAPLMRLALFQLKRDFYFMLWSFHHIMLDGWSMRLVLNEVYQVYEALEKGIAPSLAPTTPFQSYIRWLQNQDLERAENYWKQYLKGFASPTSLGLSSAQDISTDRRKRYSEKEMVLAGKLTKSLNEFAREHRITLNTLVQGAWAILLSRYSQEADVTFGVTISSRPIDMPAAERMVGLFINTLPLRVQVDDRQGLVEWLKSIQSTMLENQSYEYSPLVSIQKWSEVQPGSPLFHSIIVFENHPAKLDQPDPTASLRFSDPRYVEYSNYPLALLVVPGNQLKLILVFDNDWFDEAAIARMLSHLEAGIGQMLRKQNEPPTEISILGENERDLLLNTLNDTAVPYPDEACIHHLIEAHAQKSPSRPAVVFEDQSLTYRELNQAADALAARLMELGVQPEAMVGVFLERSSEMIIAILGILKAGGAYVPIDPTYPIERVIYYLQDTQCPVVVTDSVLVDKLPLDDYGGQPLMIDEVLSAAPENLSFNPPDIHPYNLAYVIYTSGSTGPPKGVMVSHRNLVHSTSARINYYPHKTESFLLLSSYAFDSSMVGIFGTLCQGGKLVLPRQRQEQDAASLLRLIDEHQVTHLLTLPSLYLVLLDLFSNSQLGSLNTVIVAGEACPPELASRHFQMLPDARLYNEYGPTEASVWCSVYELTQDQMHATIPIGKPIQNAKIYILDSQGLPCPIGIAGEMFVGGEGVARGYLNQPELTAQRFLCDPFVHSEREAVSSAPSGPRMYKTGDLARWRPDGNIEFLGRIDHQIKIRGYRVELGEIENSLLSYPGIRDAVVIARQEKTEDVPVPGSEASQNQYLEKIGRKSPALISQLLDEIDQLSDSEIELLLKNN